MNKVVLMGRLVRDVELKYSNGSNPVALAGFTIAANRRFRKEGEPEADFINCKAFGKTAEFIDKYFKKGQMMGVVGRIQVRSWDNAEGKKQWSTEVIAEEAYFTGSKAAESNSTSAPSSEPPNENEGFYPIDEHIQDEDLPF